MDLLELEAVEVIWESIVCCTLEIYSQNQNVSILDLMELVYTGRTWQRVHSDFLSRRHGSCVEAVGAVGLQTRRDGTNSVNLVQAPGAFSKGGERVMG